MNFVVFSDPHYDNNYSKSYTTESGISSWLQTQLCITEDIFKYCYKHNIELVIINGDLFEKKNSIGVLLYNTVWDFFKKCVEKYDVKIFFNTGNHDILRIDGSGSLKPFSDLFEIIEKPKAIPYIDNSMLYFEPYNKFAIFDVSKKHTSFLFIHEELDVFTDYESDKTFKADELCNFDYVFCGHIHKPGEYKNITNIGSIIPVDWGECGQTKRFIHFNDGDVKSIPINHPKFIDIDILNPKVRKFIERDNYNYYRISVFAEECNDTLFNKYNVTPNIIKTKHRVDRLKDTKNTMDEIKVWADSKFLKEQIVKKEDVINFMIERMSNA